MMTTALITNRIGFSALFTVLTAPTFMIDLRGESLIPQSSNHND
jgi:hypothetical protein